MMKSGSKFSSVELFSAFAVALTLCALALPRAQAQTFNVVYNFTGGNDGGSPLDGFIADSSGNLYATTFYGGASSNGVVFEISASGTETVLHTFAGGSDGQNPEGGLLLDKSGNLYGTTTAGGTYGAGTIFKITSAGEETVLHSFGGAKDGSAPQAGLTETSGGILVGTTTAGGAYGNGAVFTLTLNSKTQQWTEKVVYSFGKGKDGTVPVAGVTLDKLDNVYGTTSAGGAYGYGIVFELDRAAEKEIILHNFQDGDDGAVPYAGLIADSSGNFYGAATEGGSGGGGAVFELTPANGTWTFNVIYSNPGWGISGSFRNLVMDASGNIYGTTHCDGSYDAGTVYELTPSSGTWNFTQLYVFTGGSDGLYSFTNPVLVQNHLYGTTNQGGADGAGVVWEVTL
jgi:uncharacterized repeat protein (TIGR03803 family)